MIFGTATAGTALFSAIVLSMLLDLSSPEAQRDRLAERFPDCVVVLAAGSTWQDRAYSIDCPQTGEAR